MARTKPSIKIKRTKTGIEIIKTLYDNLGHVLNKQIEAIPKIKI